MSKPFFGTLFIFLTGSVAVAQNPIVPLWEHLYGYEAPSPSLVAFDTTSGHVYGTYYGGADDRQHVNVFDVDGTDLTPSPQLLLPMNTLDITYAHSFLRRLTVDLDVLSYIDNHSYIDASVVSNWSHSLAADGTPGFLFGSEDNQQNDIYVDTLDRMVVVRNPLLGSDLFYRFAPNGWLTGKKFIPRTDAMAVSPNRVYCGRTPDLVYIDRTTWVLSAPSTVPSSGTATKTLMTMHGGAVHYASLNDNATLDLGALDTSGTVLWNKVMSVPPFAYLTGLCVDQSGNTWVTTTVQMVSGFLYGTNSDGTLTDTYYHGLSIDGIAVAGDRIILAGRDAVVPSNTFFIAFDPATITGAAERYEPLVSLFPDPATTMVRVTGIAPGTLALEIVDGTGRVWRKMAGPIAANVDLSVADLAQGPYFVRLSEPHKAAVLRFHVVR